MIYLYLAITIRWQQSDSYFLWRLKQRTCILHVITHYKQSTQTHKMQCRTLTSHSPMASWFFSCISQSSWSLSAQWWMVRITGLVSRAPGGPQLTTGLSTVWMSSTGGLEKTENTEVKWFFSKEWQEGRTVGYQLLWHSMQGSFDLTSGLLYIHTNSAGIIKKVGLLQNTSEQSSTNSIRRWLDDSAGLQLGLGWSQWLRAHEHLRINNNKVKYSSNGTSSIF